MREVLHKDAPESLVDIIAGGPPCQAFSRIGRAKLRAVRQNPEAFQVDERFSLYLHYLEYVEFFRPLAVIMEMVTDIMSLLVVGLGLLNEGRHALNSRFLNATNSLLWCYRCDAQSSDKVVGQGTKPSAKQWTKEKDSEDL